MFSRNYLKIEHTVNGISIGNVVIRKTMYADDLTIFLEYSEEELTNAVNVLYDFSSK